jgi:hypothetical protein
MLRSPWVAQSRAIIGQCPNRRPFTTPATGGPFGLWIDQFAAKFGVVDPKPFLASGTNFAVASALTGHNPAFTGLPTVVPYTNDQLALYLLVTPRQRVICTRFGRARTISVRRETPSRQPTISPVTSQLYLHTARNSSCG